MLFCLRSPDSSLFDPPKKKELQPPPEIMTLSATSANRMKLEDIQAGNEDKNSSIDKIKDKKENSSHTENNSPSKFRVIGGSIEQTQENGTPNTKDSSQKDGASVQFCHQDEEAENFKTYLISETESPAHLKRQTPHDIGQIMQRYSLESKRDVITQRKQFNSERKGNAYDLDSPCGRLSYNNSPGLRLKNNFSEYESMQCISLRQTGVVSSRDNLTIDKVKSSNDTKQLEYENIPTDHAETMKPQPSRFIVPMMGWRNDRPKNMP